MIPSSSGAFDLSKLKSATTQQGVGPNPVINNSSSTSEVAGYLVAGDESQLRNYLQLSSRVVVLLLLLSKSDPELEDLRSELIAAMTKLDGRVIGLEIDAASNPQLAQAVGVTATPGVVAVIGGQPAPLFQGLPDRASLDSLLQQVLQLAAQNGVTGRVSVGTAAPAVVTAQDKPISPAHQAALDAFERGDLAAAQLGYATILKEFPNDLDAKVGLAQAQFLTRIQTASGNGAELTPLDQADLLYAAGEMAAAFGLLLDAFVEADPDQRNILRERLLQYFLIAGDEEPQVLAARRRLTSLLF